MNLMDNMLEVKLYADEDFLKIRETLQRIGIGSYKKKNLYQSCHILHKKGKYYITHFKELFMLDGREANFDAVDEIRRNKIASLLEDWELLEIVNPEKFRVDKKDCGLKIISHEDRENWDLHVKYNMGVKKYDF